MKCTFLALSFLDDPSRPPAEHAEAKSQPKEFIIVFIGSVNFNLNWGWVVAVTRIVHLWAVGKYSKSVCLC